MNNCSKPFISVDCIPYIDGEFDVTAPPLPPVKGKSLNRKKEHKKFYTIFFYVPFNS